MYIVWESANFGSLQIFYVCLKIHACWFTGSSIFNLYDSEIATLKLQSSADQDGLSKVAFEKFKKNHKCGVFYRLMELTELAWKFYNVVVNVHKFCFAIFKLHSSVPDH